MWDPFCEHNQLREECRTCDAERLAKPKLDAKDARIAELERDEQTASIKMIALQVAAADFAKEALEIVEHLCEKHGERLSDDPDFDAALIELKRYL